jgi:hypothetical protein
MPDASRIHADLSQCGDNGVHHSRRTTHEKHGMQQVVYVLANEVTVDAARRSIPGDVRTGHGVGNPQLSSVGNVRLTIKARKCGLRTLACELLGIRHPVALGV